MYFFLGAGASEEGPVGPRRRELIIPHYFMLLETHQTDILADSFKMSRCEMESVSSTRRETLDKDVKEDCDFENLCSRPAR